MKKAPCLLLAITLLSSLSQQFSKAFAQGTAFTYQGRLNSGANPANGSYDLGTLSQRISSINRLTLITDGSNWS